VKGVLTALFSVAYQYASSFGAGIAAIDACEHDRGKTLLQRSDHFFTVRIQTSRGEGVPSRGPLD
jgi:hypothetical protein